MAKFESYEVNSIHRNVCTILFELETTSTNMFSYSCTLYGGDTIVFHFPNYSLFIRKIADSVFDVYVRNNHNVLLFRYQFDCLRLIYSFIRNQFVSILS